jgi:hypothetical protein
MTWTIARSKSSMSSCNARVASNIDDVMRSGQFDGRDESTTLGKKVKRKIDQTTKKTKCSTTNLQYFKLFKLFVTKTTHSRNRMPF